MRVLIACEESQTVCKAFRERGHEAYSCDTQECSGGHPEWHYQGDIFGLIDKQYFRTQNLGHRYVEKWDLMIGHPPCTYLSFVGNRWFNYQRYGKQALERYQKRLDAVNFFLKLWESPIEKICLENPRGYIQEFISYSQLIHPYYFGDSQSKTTLLWLKNLPQLLHQKEDGLFESKTHVDKGAMAIHGSGSEAFFGLDILKLPQEERAKIRSKTFEGIAKAMAEQWG